MAENTEAINIAYLSRFPEYVAFRYGPAETLTGSPAAPNSPRVSVVGDARTPDDLIEDGYAQLRAALVTDLRERIATMPPAAFEQLVVDLLTAMGYGGPQDNAGLVVGRGGDEGIDGVIKEDRLGLDNIYIQAKRWEATVGRPEIQRFAGALQGQRARKGVFITTSSFSKDAIIRQFHSEYDSPCRWGATSRTNDRSRYRRDIRQTLRDQTHRFRLLHGRVKPENALS